MNGFSYPLLIVGDIYLTLTFSLLRRFLRVSYFKSTVHIDSRPPFHDQICDIVLDHRPRIIDWNNSPIDPFTVTGDQK